MALDVPPPLNALLQRKGLSSPAKRLLILAG
jgi:hypothetical protein